MGERNGSSSLFPCFGSFNAQNSVTLMKLPRMARVACTNCQRAPLYNHTSRFSDFYVLLRYMRLLVQLTFAKFHRDIIYEGIFFCEPQTARSSRLHLDFQILLK